MRRLGVVTAVLVLLLMGSASADTAPPGSRLLVSGAGGQQAVLTVPAGGLRVDYPMFSTPRLRGPDGTVGGVLIQALPSRKLVGGLLLQNVPGFDGAIEMGLVDFEGVHLKKGRYALTLLGSGRQSVALRLRGATSDVSVAAVGPARPVTTSTFGSSAGAHAWSEAVQVPTGPHLVVLGSGAGGELQQAAAGESCFREGDAGLCLTPDSSWSLATPGAGASASWFVELFPDGAGAVGDHRYSGRVVSAGVASSAASSSVVVTLPR